ncbi:MAG: 7-cyano-7-deazaguanine synthase QueC [Gammaproteobacteria bacterium]|nr:7-cyano-7-deazaguanine synthase QueC [Gammaproteobacteria bacterium]
MTDCSLRAVVLLSGGMDSATCLALARRDGCACHTLSFDYGQRHRAELAAAEQVARQLGAVDHRTVRIGLGDIGGSALTDPEVAVPTVPGKGIPVTYVPARNTVFLSVALGLAEVLDAERIYAGMNAVDYSGYPDCRPAYLEAFQNMANLATRRGVEGRPITVCTPLLLMSKAQIVRTGTELGVDFGATVSCYQATPEGEACGSCDACRLRKSGFAVAGIADPTRYR